MTFQDFVDLQGKIANVPHRVTNRSVLAALGEGQYVSYVCFIKEAHYSDTMRGESVNCNLPGPAANDIHVVLVKDPNDQDPCNSTVAEISPHYRPANWTPENLITASKNRPVRIRGQLFCDTSHSACSGNYRPNPKRISIWEIHPVYSVEICEQTMLSECQSSTAKWSPLSGLVSDDTVDDEQSGQ